MVVTQNRLHLAELFLALLDNLRIGVIGHNVIFCINEVQCSFIEM